MEPEKPDWMLQAEQDLEAWKETPLFKYSDQQLQAYAQGFQCRGCGKVYNSIHFPIHQRRCERLLQEEKTVIELHGQGLSNKEIGERSGMAFPVISKILKDHNLEDNWIRHRREIENQAIALYESGIHNFSAIADMLNEPKGSITAILGQRKKKKSERIAHTETKDQIIRDLYHNGERLSSAEMARITGYNENSIKNTLKKMGLIAWNIIRTQENRQRIIQLHLEGKTEKEIKDIVQMSHGSVNMIIRDYKQGKIQYNP